MRFEGAIYGFSEIAAQSSFNRLDQKTKIKGLFLVGAWMKPGCGLYGRLVSGNDAAGLVLSCLKK